MEFAIVKTSIANGLITLMILKVNNSLIIISCKEEQQQWEVLKKKSGNG